MKQWHDLLKQQIRHCLGKSFSIPKKWQPFIEEINQTYIDSNLGPGKEISDYKKMKDQLRSERELISALAAITDMKVALNFILDTALEIEGLDSGGIYLVDQSAKELNLVVHKNLTPKFVESVSHYDAVSSRTRLILAGEPVYTGYSELCKKILGEDKVDEESEGLRAMAVIPVKFQGKVVASLNLASHLNEEIPIDSRETMETFAALIAGPIARMEMENALRDSEDRYRTLFEEARDALIVADATTGIILEVNRATEELLKRPKKEIVGMHQSKLHPPEEVEKYHRIFEDHVQKGGSQAVEAEVITSENRRIPVEISALVLQLKSGSKIIRGSFRDITIRKRAEWELRQAKRSLEQWSMKLAEKVHRRTEEMERSKDRLSDSERMDIMGRVASSISHELNTPVTAIKNAIYFLKAQTFAKQSTQAASYLALLERQVDTCVQVMSNILDFSKTLELERRTIHLEEVIKESLSQVDVPPAVNVKTFYKEGLPALQIDPVLLRRAFANLIKNAIQAMDQGGELTISTSTEKDNYIIEFKDTGAGIPSKNINKVFEPLFSTYPNKAGLGLPVTRRIIEAHDGVLEVDSKVGQGSIFKVKLPLD